MAEPKTRRTDASVNEFIAAIPEESVREDCHTLVELFRRITGCDPQLWGESIIGFGEYRLTYANGSEAAWPRLSFAPRRRKLALYVFGGGRSALPGPSDATRKAPQQQIMPLRQTTVRYRPGGAGADRESIVAVPRGVGDTATLALPEGWGAEVTQLESMPQAIRAEVSCVTWLLDLPPLRVLIANP